MGLEFKDNTKKMENQVKGKMENEMETRLYRDYIPRNLGPQQLPISFEVCIL